MLVLPTEQYITKESNIWYDFAPAKDNRKGRRQRRRIFCFIDFRGHQGVVDGSHIPYLLLRQFSYCSYGFSKN